jgi:lipopolysaccharide transport system permease protein
MVSNTSTEPAGGAAQTFPGRHDGPRRVTVVGPPAASLSGLASDLSKLARYRDLLYTLTVHRVKVRYKQSVLGVAWAVLQPLALMLIYTVIFSRVARVPSEGLPYALFAFTALLPWLCFSTALTNGTNSLVSHSHLVTKVYFPREILPLTYVFAAFFDFAVAALILAAMMLYYRAGLTANALWVAPILLVLLVFSTASSLVFSATQVRFRDIGVAMPLVLQLWLFATPIVYPLSAVPAWALVFYRLNPMVGVVENFRRTLVQGAPPDLPSLASAAAVSVVLLATSYVYFKRVEATVADVI